MHSIAPFFRNAAFDAETTKTMGRVFDTICGQRSAKRSTFDAREVIAAQIVEVAASGEHDFERLLAKAKIALGIVERWG